MSGKITIIAGDVSVEAELNDSACAAAIADALPIESVVRTWGDEVYFEVPVRVPLSQDAREEVTVGELGYWPVGAAFCIFFGPTPASGADGAPRAASRVNPIGRVLGDAQAFRTIRDGEKIVLAPAS